MDVVIIDDDKEICNKMAEILNNDSEINVSGIAHNGIDGIKLVKKTKPSAVIIDIILSGIDGIGVLEELNHIGMIEDGLKCIVLTAVNSPHIISKAFELGAKYVLLKPCDFNIIIRRIKEIVNDKKYIGIFHTLNNNELVKAEKNIAWILNETGIMPNLKGFKYLKQAVIMCLENDSILEGVTKFLYPEIARINNTSNSRVERSIRHSIEVAWEKDSGISYYKIMGFTDHNNGKRPTNSEFIASVVDYIKMNL